MHRSSFLKFLGVSFIAACSSAYARTRNVHQLKLESLQRVSNDISGLSIPTAEMQARVSEAYRKIFGEIDIRSLAHQIEALKCRFDAANLAAFYTGQVSHAEEMRHCFALLHAAGHLDMARGKDVYQAYIAAEAFDQAQEFASTNAYLALTPLPPVAGQAETSRRQEWILAPNAVSLSAEDFAYPAGACLMIVSASGCHFSRASMRALATIPEFKAMHGRIKWLMRVERNFDPMSISTWNSSYPDFTFTIARNPVNWPEIPYWSTPNFYFFSNGEIVFHFSGWPAEGNFKNLDRGMKLAGFRPNI